MKSGYLSNRSISELNRFKEHSQSLLIESKDTVLIEEAVKHICDKPVRIVPAEGKKSINIEQVRRLRKMIYQKSDAGKQFFVVYNFGDASAEVQNAILKVLEEPGSVSKLILACQKIHGILPTVKSRCLQISLRPMNQQKLVDSVSSNFNVEASQVEKLLLSTNHSIDRVCLALEDKEVYDQQMDLIKKGKQFISSKAKEKHQLLAQVQESNSLDEFYDVLLAIYRTQISKSTTAQEYVESILDTKQKAKTNVSNKTLANLLAISQ